MPKMKYIIDPVSIILTTQDKLYLKKDNSFKVRFATGVLEGEGITINKKGYKLRFKNEGSYRFEINGEFLSNDDITLVFQSKKFSEDIRMFSEMNIQKDDTKIRFSTILPIDKNQSVVLKLIPKNTENIILLHEKTKLLIHKVV
jgi:hypothetical protein